VCYVLLLVVPWLLIQQCICRRKRRQTGRNRRALPDREPLKTFRGIISASGSSMSYNLGSLRKSTSGYLATGHFRRKTRSETASEIIDTPESKEVSNTAPEAALEKLRTESLCMFMSYWRLSYTLTNKIMRSYLLEL
jgi:hypothetical protein